MKILAFSDWRVQNIDELINFVKSLDKKPDIILYCGDDVNRFGIVPKEVIIDNVIRNLEFGSKKYCFFTSSDDKFLVLGFKKGKIDSYNRLRQILNQIKEWKNQYENLELRKQKVSGSLINNGLNIEIITGENNGKSWRMVHKSKVIDRIAQILGLNNDYEIEEIINSCEISQRGNNTLVLFSEKAENNINKFEELAKYSNYGLFGIIGNDCSKLDKHILKGEKVFDLHEKPQAIDDFIFIGQEGASNDIQPALGYVLYSEKEIEKHLYKQTENNKNKKIILVSHSPPHEVLDTAMRFSEGGSIGSLAIKKFIEKNNVILNVCGHAHYMGGKSKNLENCMVVNIASHDDIGAKGRIAIIDINKEKVDMKLIELLPSNLEAIYGIGYAYSGILEEAGIKTIKQFASLEPRNITEKTGLSHKMVNKWHLHAKSLLNEEAILLRELNIKNPVFVDIETDHTQTFVWMISVLDANKNIFRQFTAYKKKEEKKILKSFLDFISERGYKELYCYSGTNFEKRVLLSRIADYKLDESKFPIFEDLLYMIRNILILPITSYSLKELGSFFGFKWKHSDIDGFIAPIFYNEYLQSKDEKIIQKLQEYNKDDVLVLQHLLTKISKIQIQKKYSISELQKL